MLLEKYVENKTKRNAERRKLKIIFDVFINCSAKKLYIILNCKVYYFRNVDSTWYLDSCAHKNGNL